MELIKIVVIVVSLIGVQSVELNPLTTVAQWYNLDFLFPDATTRQGALNYGYWIPKNQVLIDIDVYYGCSPEKKFVTIPRFQLGVPCTLGVISNTIGANGPLIIPYPNYSWHSSHGGNCDGITSVFRIFIDQCHRLWVLDTGMIGSKQWCAPQILIFNLKTDTLIRRYRFPVGHYKPGLSLFVTPIVDVRDPAGTCVDTMVYIADVGGFGIVMYSYKNNISWRAQNKFMFPDPSYGRFNIAGESFDLMDGVLGMSVSGAIGTRMASAYSTASSQLLSTDRFLFFHPLSGGSEVIVPLRYLDNKALWDSSYEAVPWAFIQIGSRGVQSAAQAMDCNGNLFFGLNTPNAIGCWDTALPYSKPYINLIAQSDTKLQFASGVKIIKKFDKEELWTVTCRFQKVMTGTMNYGEINFRVQAAPVSVLLNNGTRCSW